MILHKGQYINVAKLAREHGIIENTLRRRLKVGSSIEKAIKPVNNIADKARKAGLKPERVRVRILWGWTLEKALNTPVRHKKRQLNTEK